MWDKVGHRAGRPDSSQQSDCGPGKKFREPQAGPQLGREVREERGGGHDGFSRYIRGNESNMGGTEVAPSCFDVSRNASSIDLPRPYRPSGSLDGSSDSLLAEISEIHDPSLKDFQFEVSQWPENFTDRTLVLRIRVGEKEYRLRTRGPSSREKVYEVARNSARTAFLLKHSGVHSCKNIQLHKNGSVKIDKPLLGERGAIKEHFDEAIRSHQIQGNLESVRLGAKGTLTLRTKTQKLEIEPERNKLFSTPFFFGTGDVSSVAAAITNFVGEITRHITPIQNGEAPRTAVLKKRSFAEVSGDTDLGVPDTSKTALGCTSRVEQEEARAPSDLDLLGTQGDVKAKKGLDYVPLEEQDEAVTPRDVNSLESPRVFSGESLRTSSDVLGRSESLDSDIVAELESMEESRDSNSTSGGRGSIGDELPPVSDRQVRTIDDAFDFAQERKQVTSDTPGYLEAVFRGKSYQPVFGKGKNFFTKGASSLGNTLLGVIGGVGTGLVHKKLGVGHTIALTDDLALGFSASGRKVKENSLKAGDPRLIGIEELRNENPRAIPVWVEGKLGQNLSFDFGHSVPLGASGACFDFGFKADEKLDFTMNRLVHFDRGLEPSMADAKDQLRRLKLTPLKGEDLSKMETGASFAISGKANLRLDAGIGLGATVPAITNVAKVGANVEAGAFASLSGNFGLDVKRLAHGVARVTVSSGAAGSAGVKLSAFAGAQVEQKELSRLLRGFVSHVAGGGSPDAFGDSLENDEERALASSMFGYTNLLVPFARNLADGAGSAAVDHAIKNYASAAFEARKGIEIKKQFSTNLDFDLNSKFMVTLPRADMLPESMWGGKSEGQPIKVEAGKLATLAYNMAVRGDLRLAQQAALIRSSGVRINERETTDTTTTADHLSLKIPFAEFSRNRSTSTKQVDRYTPEMGRTKSLIESFNCDYVNFFGDTEDYGAEIRVHTPEGKRNEKLFVGSDENFSADFVVENLTEKWTNFEEMQDYLGVLNALSEGRLEKRCHDALAQGEYRDREKLSLWDRVYLHREYGRTTARLHVWLGEAGLRTLLDVDHSEDDYYEKVGEVFTNLDSKGSETLPWWSIPGADRSIEDAHGKAMEITGGGADAYGVEEQSRDLKAARYIVDNLMRLQTRMRHANTPAKERKLAGEIRDFLKDAKSKYSAYAALAMLVPEHHRAVEIRLSSIRPKKTPIRITYIQDGRSPDLLHATGYSKMALKQLTRYGSVLDPENKARIGNLLKTLNGVLNSPSPDLFILKRSLNKLREEMELLDKKAPQMESLIAGDIGMARAFMDSLPDAQTIQEILPGALGTNLATMRIKAERELNKAQPDFVLVRQQMQNILKKMPYYRHIQGAREIIDSTAQLSQALAKSRPDLVQAAVEAVNEFRGTLERDKLEASDMEKALEQVISINALLSSAMGERLNHLGDLAAEGAVGEIEDSIQAQVAERGAVLSASELKSVREAEANKYRDMAGDPKTAAVSYFERTGAVPKAFMGTALRKLENGAVTTSMIREAELAMATSRPTGLLAAPDLSQSNVTKLLTFAKEKKAQEFLKLADELRFRPEPNYDDPSRIVIESLLASIPKDQRGTILAGLSQSKKDQLNRVFADFDASEEAGRPVRSREAILDNHPAQKADLKFLRELVAQGDSKSLEAGLNSLGYNKQLQKWHAKSITRLEAVFAQMSGKELNKLAKALTNEERKSFLELLKTSDLRPQTRARLAGTIVDKTVFWRKDEELVEALVTNLNAGDLRLFFDQLYTDGKLENFLSAGSWWQTLFEVFTFGLARLWTHNNKAALRVVAAKGWQSSELRAQYNTHIPLNQRIDQQAESIFLGAALDTVPMDPVVKTGIRAVHSICGNVKYYELNQLPQAARQVLEKVAEGAGLQLICRLVDVAKQGGSPSEIATEYEKFFSALTPDNIAKEFGDGDKEGTAVVLAMALRKGSVKKLEGVAKSGKNKFITPELIDFLDDLSSSAVDLSDDE